MISIAYFFNLSLRTALRAGRLPDELAAPGPITTAPTPCLRREQPQDEASFTPRRRSSPLRRPGLGLARRGRVWRRRPVSPITNAIQATPTSRMPPSTKAETSSPATSATAPTTSGPRKRPRFRHQGESGEVQTFALRSEIGAEGQDRARGHRSRADQHAGDRDVGGVVGKAEHRNPIAMTAEAGRSGRPKRSAVTPRWERRRSRSRANAGGPRSLRPRPSRSATGGMT